MQFRLSTLLLSILVVATSLALAGGWGIPCAAYMLLLVACARAALTRGYGLAGVLGVLFVAVVLLFLVLPLHEDAGPARQRAQCCNNLKQIALALLAYRDTYGRFPPARVADTDGKPMHSWRVLILPFLERKDLYDHYNFKEPWNGPANAKLAASRPSTYVCPADTSEWADGATTTSYLAVVGPGTIWTESGADPSALGPKPDTAANVAQRASTPEAKVPEPPRKILLVEVANSGVNWMEPRDLTLEEALAGINPQSSPAISSEHEQPGANVAFADGCVEFLLSETPRARLKWLLPEGLDDAKLARMEEPRRSQPKPNDYLGLRFIAWALSVVALLTHGLILDVRRKRAADKTAPDPAAASPGSRGDA